MKVFISWSKDLSRELANELRNWLPSVLQSVKPYFTPDDIEKGRRWSNEIALELDGADIGIVCLTKENIESSWIMFESGALSKSLDKSYVCPILFNISNSELKGPLTQFQTTQFNKTDFRKLIFTMNECLGENKLTENVVDAVFEKWWPDLESKINQILNNYSAVDTFVSRTDRDILEEILLLNRKQMKNSPPNNQIVSTTAIEELIGTYVNVCQLVKRGLPHDQILRNLEDLKEPIEHISKYSTRQTVILDELNERLQSIEY